MHISLHTVVSTSKYSSSVTPLEARCSVRCAGRQPCWLCFARFCPTQLLQTRRTEHNRTTSGACTEIDQCVQETLELLVGNASSVQLPGPRRVEKLVVYVDVRAAG